MRVLRAIAIGLGVLLLLIAGVAFGARYADGPVALFPGGAFRSGEWIEDTEADLSFAADIEEIQLESGDPPSTRTVWILVEGGKAYIPCSLSFPPLKRWHIEALERPAAIVRIDGKLYHRRLHKVQDPAVHARLIEVVTTKYGGGIASNPDGVWFFELAPATAD